MASVPAIIGSASALAKLAASSAIWMYTFVDGQQTINDDIRALHDELRHLQQNVDGFRTLLEMPELQAIQDARLWSDASETLLSCDASLRRFEAKVSKLKPSSKGTWSPKDMLRGLKRDIRHEGLVNARRELQSHNLALLGVQSKISVYVAMRGPGLVAEELISRLLPRLLTRLDTVSDRVASMESTHQVEAEAADEPASLSKMLQTKIEETANIVGRARTIIQSW